MPKRLATEGRRKPAPATTPLVHLQVPPGMDAALRGLTREVLRRQPSDLYLFAHRYFESLLADRVAQQGGDEVTDAESLFSKKESMRDRFHEDESRKESSREIVHRIQLEDNGSSDKNVVHNINIEVEGDDASIEETTVKVEITEDEGKKRKEIRDTTFEEEIRTTRTEHVTVCKSWKVETRVETSESGEIRVESFTDAGKTRRSSKPRKFAREEGKKSKSLIEEEQRTAKAQREERDKKSSKSKSFENVDQKASRELIMLERQATAQKLKSDEEKKYKSFVQLDDDESAADQTERFKEIEREDELARSKDVDSMREVSLDGPADQSERLIEIEREDALAQSRGDVGDSTREVSPDGPANQSDRLIEIEREDALARSKRDVGDSTREVSPDGSAMQSPQVALQKMEESLIQLKELEKDESLKRTEDVSQDDDNKAHELRSPEDALIQMERSLIELKETSLASGAETQTEKRVSEILTGPEEGSLEEKEPISVKSEDESKSSILEEKHKIIENVKEVVHKIEEKASKVFSHIHGDETTEEKQSIDESKSSEENKSIDESKSSKEKQSIDKSESSEEKQSISESKSSVEKNKIIEDVKEVVHEIEEKASSVFSHIHGTQTAEEKLSMSIKSEDDSISEKKHKIIEDVKEVVHEIEEKTSSVLTHFPEKTGASTEKTEVLDGNPDDAESIVVEAQIEENQSPEPEKTETLTGKAEVLDSNADDKTEDVGVETDEKSGPEQQALVETTEVIDLTADDKGSVDSGEVKGETTGPELKTEETSAERTEVLEVGLDDRNLDKADVLEKEGLELKKIENGDEKTEDSDLNVKGTESIVAEAETSKQSPEPEETESSAEKTEDLNLNNKESIVVEAETTKQSPEPDLRESSAEKTEDLNLNNTDSIVVEAETTKQSPEPEQIESSAEKAEDLNLNNKESIVVEAETTKQSPEPDHRESPAEKTEGFNINNKGSIVVEAETTKQSPEPEQTESSAEKTEDLNLNNTDSIVVEAETTKQSPEPEQIESSVEKAEDLNLNNKESIVVEAETTKQSPEPDQRESSAEKTEDVNLNDKESIVVEAPIKEAEEMKAIEESGRESDESHVENEEADEGESKGRPKRDVEASELVESADDETAKDKNGEADTRGSKEEPLEEELTRQSSKEEQTSLESPKENEDKNRAEQKEEIQVEDNGKEAEKEYVEFLKEEHENEADIQHEQEASMPGNSEETTGEEQTQERFADELLEEKRGKEEEGEAEPVTRSTDSENKDAAKATGEGPEVKDVADEGDVDGGDSSHEKEILVDTTFVAVNLQNSADQLDEISRVQVKKNIEETELSTQEENLEAASTKTTVAKEAPDSASKEISVEKETTEVKSSGLALDDDKADSEIGTAEKVEQQDIQTKSASAEPPSDKDTSQPARIRRSMAETFTKTEEKSERISTSTHRILLGGPGSEIRSSETEVKEHEEKLQMKTLMVRKEVIDIDDVFGHKTYPVELVDTLLERTEKQECHEGKKVDEEVQIEDPPEKIKVSESSDVPMKGKEGSVHKESSEENPRQRKLGSLDEESSSVSEGTGDGFLPPTVVISRVADVVELTDGEAKIVSQMEKEGLTTEYDESAKVRAGYWSAEDANKFLAGESQHTYNTLRKPELIYTDLHEARPPEKPAEDEPEKSESDEGGKAEEIEAPSMEYVVEEQEESSPDKTDSLGQDSDSRGGPVKFSLVEVDDDGKEIKEEKPWLARAHTVEEIFEKQIVGEVIPVAPISPRRSSVPGQVNVMMEMSKATSRIGQSIMALSGGEKRPVQHSDSDEYIISEDAIYIPLRPPGTEPDIVEESDDEPFRIDQPPPTFSSDSDDGEWGRALAEHITKEPSLTTVIIERKVDDPVALGRVTIREITDEEETAMTKEDATESKGTSAEELPKPVFEIGSPVSDRNTDLGELRSDAKHRPSLADISEENLESAEDNEGSMNVELHISLSDGDSLSQRSYGTDSERKWTEDLSNVAHKAKDAATGLIKNIFGSSPRKDRHSPARSESSLLSEADVDEEKRTRKLSESREQPGTVKDDKTKVEQEETMPEDSAEVPKSHDSTKHTLSTKSTDRSDHKCLQTETDLTQKEIKDEDEHKATPRSLPGSSEETTSLTSVSLPLPDASYDLANVTSSTSTVDTPGGSDVKDDIPITSETSKPGADEPHRSKQSVEHEEVATDQSDQKIVSEGSGAAAGSAAQNAAEAMQDKHEKENTQPSAKHQTEAGLAGQGPASEPKDSITSVISETLDSVESLPSEVSKNLWSIEDVPLAENLSESDVQDGTKGSKNVAAQVQESEGEGDREGSPEKGTGVVDDLLETIESQVETLEESVDNVRERAKDEMKSGEEKVEGLAREAKEGIRHKLTRGVEVAEESLEDAENEGKRIGSEVEKELEDKSEAIKDSIATAKDGIEGEVIDVRDKVEKSAQDAEEEVRKVGKDIEEKAEEGKATVEEVVQQGKSMLGGILDNVEEAIDDAKEEITSVFKKQEDRFGSLEEKTDETVDEISVEVRDNIKNAEDNVEEKVEGGKSGLSKLIGGVADAISDVKEKVSGAVTHVKEDVKGMVTKSEMSVEKEITEMEETTKEQVEKVKVGIEKKTEDASKLKTEVIDAVERRGEKGMEKVEDMKEKVKDEFEEVADNIGEKVDIADETIEKTVRVVEDNAKETAKKIGVDTEKAFDEGEKVADPFIERELDEVQRRLEESIEREDDGIDTVDGTKEKMADKGETDAKSKTKDTEKSDAEISSTTRMVLDKRKSEDEKSDGAGTSKLLVRSIEIPETVALTGTEKGDAQTDSSGKKDSFEARRTKRHILKRGVTLGDLPQSADVAPSESVDETSTSFERADTVIHLTLDESETGGEATHKEEVLVPIHVEQEEATPVPPGKDTKSTETDLLEKETVSRGTEPEETTEQMAEALRSEVKDLEERLSRLKESTWSLSHTGPEFRKGHGKIHASKSDFDESDEVTERKVHVKKSISSAESMSFASRVLSTPMGSVKEEYSEMKKSMAETTHETILTVEKGVQSEGGEDGNEGKGDSERRTTVTTATQVSGPSNDTSDDESRKSHFQRAKSMDAKAEARAITNFSKRNSKKAQKVDSSQGKLKHGANLINCVPLNRAQDIVTILEEKYDRAYLNGMATRIQAAYRGYRARKEMSRCENGVKLKIKKVCSDSSQTTECEYYQPNIYEYFVSLFKPLAWVDKV